MSCLFFIRQIFEKTKEEKLRNQQREYEAQLQYRQHLQVSKHSYCAILFYAILPFV